MDEIISYIELQEEEVDGEWGSGRTLEQLIQEKCMPELYLKLLAIKMQNQ